MPDRADRSFMLALCVSLLLHGTVVASAFWIVKRIAAPSLSVQSGAGGDGIRPGTLEIVAPIVEQQTEVYLIEAPDFGQTDSQIIADDPVTAPPQSRLLATGLGPSPGGSISGSAAWIGLPPTTQPIEFVARNGKRGAGGLGGDGNATVGAPSPSAKNKPPKYPSEARRAGYEGTVLLDVDVVPSGAVQAVSISQTSGYAILDDAAVQAVRDWTFQSTNADSITTCRVRLPVRFVLSGSPSKK
jgi:protein TonB